MRRTLLVTIVILSAIGATVTAVAVRRRPVVGFAYARPSGVYLDLARAALQERGVPIPAFLYDSMATTETSDGALAFATALVMRSDVAVVVGPSNSRHALATAPAYNTAGLAQIVPSATSRRLREAGSATFTLAPDDSAEGEFLAHFAYQQLGARRALLYYVNDEYGEGLRAGIVAAFSQLGGTIIEVDPLGSGTDVDAMVAAGIPGRRADVVFCAARSAETGLILRAVRMRARVLPVIAGDGAYLPAELLRNAQGDLSGLYVMAFWVYDSTNAAHRAFAERVRRILKTEPTPEDALTEDALVLATEARRAAGRDRAAVRRWLAGLGRDHPPFEGLTGRIGFGPQRTLPLAMVRFRDGRAERVDRSLVVPPPAP
jgi:branched-chain amino acid transport system substrate-binding protein